MCAYVCGWVGGLGSPRLALALECNVVTTRRAGLRNVTKRAYSARKTNRVEAFAG